MIIEIINQTTGEFFDCLTAEDACHRLCELDEYAKLTALIEGKYFCSGYADEIIAEITHEFGYEKLIQKQFETLEMLETSVEQIALI
jgi:hypothetical protein